MTADLLLADERHPDGGSSLAQAQPSTSAGRNRAECIFKNQLAAPRFERLNNFPRSLRTSSHRMIDSFSEFFASRSEPNRLASYREMISDTREQASSICDDRGAATQRAILSPIERARNHAVGQAWPRSRSHRLRFKSNRLLEKLASDKRRALSTSHCWPPGAASAPEPIRKFPQDQARKWPAKQELKSSAGFLLSALFNSKRRARGFRDGSKTRFQVLAKLLRLPAVLGAMFSLSLVITLLVLYALNFHHCEQLRLKQQQSSLKNFSVSWASDGPGEQPQQHHHINSRHLAGEAKVALVSSECARHVGRADSADSFAFRSIAYASAPVGARRWQRPRPIWQDEQQCSRASDSQRPLSDLPAPPAPHCLQVSPFGGEQKQLTGSEDCLYLDIFVPSSALPTSGPGTVSNHSNQNKAKLPVMFYIHGGFLAYGSNGGQSDDSYAMGASLHEADAAFPSAGPNLLRARPSGQLAAELNVLLVAPNFRLQALGFMALDQFGARGAAGGASGNYGLWDQLVALEWVQRNVRQFGGDPDNVILFGPDSASALPLAMLAAASEPQKNSQRQQTPPPKLPFHAIWLTNPTLYFDLPHELANQHYERLIRSQSICSSRIKTSVGSVPAPAKATGAGNRGAADEGSLAQCLMGLAGEQIVREYLGKDDASYRLDDQNSLPIRNIFPDQFVDVDGDLVKWSFPFRPADPNQAHELALRHQASPNKEFGNNNGAKNSEPVTNKLRFLIGSSAEAVEYWPCPRNLHSWNWQDFRHYVGASLNSFSPTTYARASQMYRVPEPEKNSQNASPSEVYLKMASDIRQVCPANELASNLALHEERPIVIQRYIVEQRPSSELSRQIFASRQPRASGAKHVKSERQRQAEVGDTDINTNRTQLSPLDEPRLSFSFHYLDLMAFFGYNTEVSEPDRLDTQDVLFQTNIRQMVKNFVLGQETMSTRSSRGYTLLKSGIIQEVPNATYRQSECEMWREVLNGQSYAWIS